MMMTVAKLVLAAVPEASLGAFELTVGGGHWVFDGRVTVRGMDVDPYELEMAALAMANALIDKYAVGQEIHLYSDNDRLTGDLAVSVAEVERKGARVN